MPAAETWLPAILAMAGLILASGFFSSSETALFYLSRDDLIAFRVGRRRQRMVADLLADPDRLLTAVLFGKPADQPDLFRDQCRPGTTRGTRQHRKPPR
ncbi:MAG: hypothetical protein CM1200mP2_47570 [Planctomycetaceae bacterium]|nr:MAG: hypothetical protein CM1200mP2_47570 [Planctomycetaceae bacterium]